MGTARHLLRQGPVVGALFQAGVASARPRPASITLPGEPLTQVVPPRHPDLIRDYLRHCGADPAWYRGQLPAHLFPQWGFPLLARSLAQVPYDLRKVLNGGCRIEIHRPLPVGEPLQLTARLESIDDNGRRAVIRNRLTTGTASAPDALDCWMFAIVPLARGDGKKERPTVPLDARELARFRFSERTARDFAALTGDVNPIHWLPVAARAAGFRNTILHGFATLAHALEALNKTRFAGDPTRLASVDVQFTRPVVLPARAALYQRSEHIFVGPAPGGPTYLTGEFVERTDG